MQVVFLWSMSLTFGCWLGMVFAENDEIFDPFEIFMYWFQHASSALGAPLVCVLTGRFASFNFLSLKNALAGFSLFSIYMRYFLMPISFISYANLNHTLCGVDNDPWRRTFDMGKYYYYWAEYYLCLPSVTCFYCLFGVMWLCRKLIGGKDK